MVSKPDHGWAIIIVIAVSTTLAIGRGVAIRALETLWAFAARLLRALRTVLTCRSLLTHRLLDWFFTHGGNLFHCIFGFARCARRATLAPFTTRSSFATFPAATATRTLLFRKFAFRQFAEFGADPVDLFVDKFFNIVRIALIGAGDDCIGNT